MRHFTDDELVLYYYGEGRRRDRIERHLEVCGRCRSEYHAIASTLGAIIVGPVPERGDRYGLEVWQRIRHELPERHRGWWSPLRTACAAVAVVIVAVLVVGRLAPRHAISSGDRPAAATTARSGGERVRADALADHLDRSERLLLDFEHDPSRDLADEQAWAADLVDANRLYRDAAVRAGDLSSAAVLDDLERQLLDIVHAPARPTPQQLDDLRTRLEAAALLFKVRVLHDQLRARETNAPASPRTTT